MYDYDVIIVGAGPAGSAAALRLAALDPALAQRSLLLDRARFPRPKLCGGGLTPRAESMLEELGVPQAVPALAVHETNMSFVDRTLTQKGAPAFRVVRREQLDHALVQAARARGVACAEGEPVDELVLKADAAVVCTPKRRYRARVVIGADGAKGVVRQQLGLVRADRTMRALEVLTPPGEDEMAAFAEGRAVFDFRPLASGVQGYYWDFPSYREGVPMMNRGIFDSRVRSRQSRAPLKQALEAALQARGVDLAACTLLGHPARCYDPAARHSAPRVLLAGDAVGCEPLLGEGITSALGLGILAAETAVDGLARDDLSFADYERRIRTSEVGRWMRGRRLAAYVFYGSAGQSRTLGALWFRAAMTATAADSRATRQ